MVYLAMFLFLLLFGLFIEECGRLWDFELGENTVSGASWAIIEGFEKTVVLKTTPI